MLTAAVAVAAAAADDTIFKLDGIEGSSYVCREGEKDA